MIYLDYAKKTKNGYILNFFADDVNDLKEVSNGKEFITKNGTNYGIPLASSTAVITMPDKTRKTYILGEDGKWSEGSSGGGTSVQSDYNQNDSTAADYIKNRPFYATEEYETAITKEGATYTKDSDTGLYMLMLYDEENILFFQPFDKIRVNWGGQIYNLTAQNLDDGIVAFGNLSIYAGGADTGEPFMIVCEKVDGVMAFSVLAIKNEQDEQSSFSIAILKAAVKTIDPKFIKDMYHETVSETKLFDGTVNITQSGSDYEGEISPAIDLGKTGDICKIVLDGTEYSLTVVESLLGKAAISADSKIKIQTTGFSNPTTIYADKAYTNAALVITNIHTEVTQIPSRYIPNADFTIELTANDFADTTIQTALKTYFTDNADALEKIKTVSSFTLKVTASGATLSYKFIDNFNAPVLQSLLRSFISIFYGTEELSTEMCVYAKLFRVTYADNDIGVQYKTSVVYEGGSGTLKFAVAPKENDSGETQTNVGELGFFISEGDFNTYKATGDTVFLHNWITLAQQRDDFAIPTPTKATDLVDKQYVDGKATGGLTKETVRLELSGFTYDSESQEFTLNETAVASVTQVINTILNKRGMCTAFAYVGDKPLKSYNVFAANDVSGNPSYIEFSAVDYTETTLEKSLNYLIYAQTTSQKCCSNTTLLNYIVGLGGYIDFDIYYKE